ncbi:hypothetical protein LguiB_007880 [Lonicera macranthoides]
MKSTANFIKGYGKVNPIEDEEEEAAAVSASASALASHQLSKKNTFRKRSITLLLLLFPTLLIGATIAAFIIHNSSTTKSPYSRPSLTDSTRSVCSVTQYPESCFTSISSSLSSLKNNSSNPELIFTLSLRVAAEELANISSLPKRLISESNETRSVSALTDCVSLFDDALSQLNNSVAAYVGVGEKVSTEEKTRDLNAWISAAMTDQDTCLEGLEEMGSKVVDEVRTKVEKSKEYMSNSLAILANIHSLLVKFGLTMH